MFVFLTATPLVGLAGHQTVLVMAALMSAFLLGSVVALLVSGALATR